MFNVRQMSAPLSRKNLPENPTADDILNTFLDYLTATDTEPYDHQEEAILELFAGNNVILNTPTGSGKSLVALALQFKSLCQGRRSYYTVPIKALANEKFLSLCHALGPENVSMITGDATVMDREIHFASWFHTAPAWMKPLLSRSTESNRQTGTHPSHAIACVHRSLEKSTSSLGLVC